MGHLSVWANSVLYRQHRYHAAHPELPTYGAVPTPCPCLATKALTASPQGSQSLTLAPVLLFPCFLCKCACRTQCDVAAGEELPDSTSPITLNLGPRAGRPALFQEFSRRSTTQAADLCREKFRDSQAFWNQPLTHSETFWSTPRRFCKGHAPKSLLLFA